MGEMQHTAVDWSQAPRQALWWAMDADGQAHWYCRPDVAAFTDFWFAKSERAPTFGYAGDWRESLTARPDRPSRTSDAATP